MLSKLWQLKYCLPFKATSCQPPACSEVGSPFLGIYLHWVVISGGKGPQPSPVTPVGPFYQTSWNPLGHPGKHILLPPSTDEETEAAKPPVGTQWDFFFPLTLSNSYSSHRGCMCLIYAPGLISLHEHLTSRDYEPHFTDGQTKVQRSEATSPKSHSNWGQI